MHQGRIAFIGGGNMARSLIGGLIGGGADARSICVSDVDSDRLATLTEAFNVRAATHNGEATQGADLIILTVKPQVLKVVAQELAPAVQRRRPLVISVAAGVRVADLSAWLGGQVALVRAMPNTPALVRSGATALYATPQASEAQRAWAESVMRAAGVTVWLDDEALMDAVTALSGSGPAYFFLVMEAMEQAGVELGLERDTARLLTLQTALGAAKMALESADDPQTLRRRVTSPGGTTEQAIAVLEQADTRGIFARALQAANSRSRELAQLFGSN